MAVQHGIVSPGSILRPPISADFLAKATPARVGLVIALTGIMVAMVAFIGSLVNADTVADGGIADSGALANNAWTFGVATAGFAFLKIGIALVLLGIVRRLWVRVESVKVGLATLLPAADDRGKIDSATTTTPYGPATVTQKAPGSLGIHRMAYKMWAPMLVMGAMAVGIGLVFAIIEAVAGSDGDASDFRTFSALAQGTEFLGEALILAGISFLLGSILGSLRQGGGEVQESLGAVVKTPAMPTSAKVFVMLMMVGLMLGMVQFVVYLVAAAEDDAATVATYFAWLGPLREASLGIMLTGIVLALATIGTKILPFQFWRIQELIRTGK